MNFDLEYFEDGEHKIKTFNIEFISNAMRRKRDSIIEKATDVKISWDKMQENYASIAAKKNILRENKEADKEKLKQEIDELSTENGELAKKIRGVGTEEFFNARYELAKEILEKNGVTEEKFFSYDFWDNNVNMQTMIKLIDEIIDKDVPKKKQEEKK
ncbi:MAG: hypothetical protein PVF17_00710 [Ignavibacteria bacterium]|jgi:hypothetical protein